MEYRPSDHAVGPWQVVAAWLVTAVLAATAFGAPRLAAGSAEPVRLVHARTEALAARRVPPAPQMSADSGNNRAGCSVH